MQAQALAERLAHVELDAVFSSDLRRAADTAAEVARAQGLETVELPGLREVDVGSWSGLTRDEAEQRFPAGFARWQKGFPGWDDGESYEEMTEPSPRRPPRSRARSRRRPGARRLPRRADPRNPCRGARPRRAHVQADAAGRAERASLSRLLRGRRTDRAVPGQRDRRAHRSRPSRAASSRCSASDSGRLAAAYLALRPDSRPLTRSRDSTLPLGASSLSVPPGL